MFIKSDSDICAAQFVFGAGFLSSRELPQLPHVVEHLVMDAPEIREAKARAAITNAHTTETQISFELTCLAADFSRNVELFLRAFSHIQIKNFAKNLSIVKREFETVAPARILLENNLNKLASEIFANHAEHLKSLDTISEDDARTFWRENLSTQNLQVFYSASREESILSNYSTSQISRPISPKLSNLETVDEIRAGDDVKDAMKTLVLPCRVENVHDFATLKLYASILNHELSEKLRAQGLIYSLSMSIFTDLIENVALINVSFRARDENIEEILSQIVAKVAISPKKFEFCKKRFLLNFAIAHQTPMQKIAFAREQMNLDFENVGAEKFAKIVAGLSLADVAKIAI